jgi:hypothetical protein
MVHTDVSAFRMVDACVPGATIDTNRRGPAIGESVGGIVTGTARYGPVSRQAAVEEEFLAGAQSSRVSAGCQAGSPGESARPGGQPVERFGAGPVDQISGMGRVSRVAGCTASLGAVPIPTTPVCPEPLDRNSVHRRLRPPEAQCIIVFACRPNLTATSQTG